MLEKKQFFPIIKFVYVRSLSLNFNLSDSTTEPAKEVEPAWTYLTRFKYLLKFVDRKSDRVWLCSLNSLEFTNHVKGTMQKKNLDNIFVVLFCSKHICALEYSNLYHFFIENKILEKNSINLQNLQCKLPWKR